MPAEPWAHFEGCCRLSHRSPAGRPGFGSRVSAEGCAPALAVSQQVNAGLQAKAPERPPRAPRFSAPPQPLRRMCPFGSVGAPSPRVGGGRLPIPPPHPRLGCARAFTAVAGGDRDASASPAALRSRLPQPPQGPAPERPSRGCYKPQGPKF